VGKAAVHAFHMENNPGRKKEGRRKERKRREGVELH
jgi:hypothetical protein